MAELEELKKGYQKLFPVAEEKPALEALKEDYEKIIQPAKVGVPLVTEEEKRVAIEMAKTEVSRLQGELATATAEKEKEPSWWKQAFTKEFWFGAEKPRWQMTKEERAERDARVKAEQEARVKELAGEPYTLLPTAMKDEKAEVIKNYELAIQSYETFINQADNPAFFSEVKRGVSETVKEPKKLIPFYGAVESLDEMIRVINAGKKIERDIPLTRLEESLVEKYKAKQLPIPSSVGHGVGKIIASMPTYIAEWGFLRSLVMVPVTKAVTAKIGTSVASKIAANAIGMAAHGASNVPEIGRRTAEYLIPNYDTLQNPIYAKLYEDLGTEISFQKALIRAFGTTEVDYITEYAGVLVQKPISFLARATLGKWLARFGLIVPEKFAGLARQVGWNGIIGEVFEEELAELFQAPMEERKYYGLNTPEGMERLWTETLGIGAFGGIGGISATTLTNIGDYRDKEKPKPVEMPEAAKPPEPPKFMPSQEAEVFKSIGNFTTADKRTITLEGIERDIGAIEEGVKRGTVLNEDDTATFEQMKSLRDRLKEKAERVTAREREPRAEVPAVAIEVKPLTEPETKPDETRVSIIDQPLNQAGYLYYLANTGKPVPADLKELVQDMNTESMQNFGEPTFLPVKGKPGVYKINYSEEFITKEGIEEFYPAEEYKGITDWKKLQEGMGIDLMQIGLVPEKRTPVYWTDDSGRHIVGIVIDIFDTREARVRTTEGIKEIDIFSVKPLPKTLTSEMRGQLNALRVAMGIEPEKVEARVPGAKREYPRPTNAREIAIDDLLPRRVPYVKLLKTGRRLVKAPEWWGFEYFLVKETVPPEVMTAFEEGQFPDKDWGEETEAIKAFVEGAKKGKPAEITGKGHYEKYKHDVIEITSENKKYYFNINYIAALLKPFLGADLLLDPKITALFSSVDGEIVGLTMPISEFTIKDLTNFVAITLPEAPAVKPAPEIVPEKPEAIKEAIPVEKREIIPIEEISDWAMGKLTWGTVAKTILDKWKLPEIETIGKMNREELQNLKDKLRKLPSMPLRDSGLKGLAYILGGNISKADKVDLFISKTINNKLDYIEIKLEKLPKVEALKGVKEVKPEVEIPEQLKDLAKWAEIFTRKAFRDVIHRATVATERTPEQQKIVDSILDLSDSRIIKLESPVIESFWEFVNQVEKDIKFYEDKLKDLEKYTSEEFAKVSGGASLTAEKIIFKEALEKLKFRVGEEIKPPTKKEVVPEKKVAVKEIPEKVYLLSNARFGRTTAPRPPFEVEIKEITKEGWVDKKGTLWRTNEWHEATPEETDGKIIKKEERIDITGEVMELFEVKHKPRKVRPQPDYWDGIDMIIHGKTPMKVPADKTEWIKALGKGNYMRIFSGGRFAEATDEVAERLGMTENELREKIIDKLKAPKPKSPEEVMAHFAAEEQKKALRKTAPWIARALDNDLDWSSLEWPQQQAIKLWVQQKREGLPPEVLEQTEELRYQLDIYGKKKEIRVEAEEVKLEFGLDKNAMEKKLQRPLSGEEYRTIRQKEVEAKSRGQTTITEESKIYYLAGKKVKMPTKRGGIPYTQAELEHLAYRTSLALGRKVTAAEYLQWMMKEKEEAVKLKEKIAPITEELAPLVEEAKLYKTAEAFDKGIKDSRVLSDEDLPPTIQDAKGAYDRAKRDGDFAEITRTREYLEKTIQDFNYKEVEKPYGLSIYLGRTSTRGIVMAHGKEQQILVTAKERGEYATVGPWITTDAIYRGPFLLEAQKTAKWEYKPTILKRPIYLIKEKDIPGTMKRLKEEIKQVPIKWFGEDIRRMELHKLYQELGMLKQIKNELTFDAKEFYNKVRGAEEITEELRLPGIPKRMKPQVLIEEAERARKERDSPVRDFETLLNVKINPDVAFSKLVEIAKEIGIKIKVVEMGIQDGKFSVTRDGTVIRGISVKDINDYLALTHELGHGIDFVVVGNRAYPSSLSERIGEAETLKGEQMLRAELKRASDFVRPFDRQGVKKAYLFYRNRRREMFADWISLYFTDTERAMTLAPNFTSAMEMRHPKITELRNKFLLPVQEIVPHDLPKKGIIGIYDGFIKGWGKIVPKGEVKVFIDHQNSVKKMGNRMLNLVGLPFWRGLSNEKFYPIYRAVQDHAIYGFNGGEAQMLKTLNFKLLEALPEISKNRIVKAIYTGNDKEIQTYFTDEQLREGFRMTDEEIDTYQRIVMVLKQGTENMIEARKLRYGFYELTPERQKELEPIIKAQVEKLGGYFPLDRFGEIAVFGRAIDPTTGKESPFFALREDRNEAVKLANLLSTMGYRDVAVYSVKHLPAEFFRNMKRFSFSDLENVAEAAGIDAESPDIKKIKDYLAKASWDKHLIQRKWVPGYERTWDNLVRTITSFIGDTSRRYYKSKAMFESQKALKDIDPYKEPETYAYAQNYIRDFFYTSPSEFYEVRKGIYFYYLAFKTSFLLQNLTQPLITTLPEIANYVGGVKAPLVFTLSLKDAGKYLKARRWGGTPGLSAMTVRLVDRAYNERVISGMLTEQLLGIVHPARQKIENVVGAFGIASEAMNRTITAISAIRIAEKYLKMEDEEQIYSFLKEMVEKTQFPYGSQNIPQFISGAGRVKGFIKTLAVFKMFQLNYLHFLGQRVVKGSLGAKAWAFTTLFTLAGLFGTPFAYLINWILRKLFGIDIRTEVRKLFGEGKQAFADVVLYGVPTLANMNLSYLIGLGDIISPTRDPTNQIFGAAAGIANRMARGIDLIKQGKTQEGIGYLLPPTLGNIVQAQKWAAEGKKFKPDVWTEFSKWEIAQRVLSFYPAKLSKQWEVKEIEADLYSRYKTIRSRFMEDIKAGKSFSETKDKFEKDIEEHNEKVEEDLFIMYEALGMDISKKEYRSIEKKYTIEKTQLRDWQEDAKKEMKK